MKHRALKLWYIVRTNNQKLWKSIQKPAYTGINIKKDCMHVEIITHSNEMEVTEIEISTIKGGNKNQKVMEDSIINAK